jgi:AAA domain, putative AbiEii toxin, Type IV TA system
VLLARALMHDPDVLFLDEPTNNLDPQSRLFLWDRIRSLRERGVTLVLTTHDMDEAERLCDRVAIVDRGRIIAMDTPGQLRHAIPGAAMSPGSGPSSWGRREPLLRRLALRMARRCASRVPLATDSQDPSGSGCRTGRRISDLTRHSRSAPAAEQALHRAWDQKPRSASSSMPGPRHPVSAAASFCSPSARGPMAAPSRARVPQAMRATTRTCG